MVIVVARVCGGVWVSRSGDIARRSYGVRGVVEGFVTFLSS